MDGTMMVRILSDVAIGIAVLQAITVQYLTWRRVPDPASFPMIRGAILGCIWALVAIALRMQ
jgi:hypothetical protein